MLFKKNGPQSIRTIFLGGRTNFYFHQNAVCTEQKKRNATSGISLSWFVGNVMTAEERRY